MITLLLIVIAVISYLLGGFNGAIIISKYVFHKDVRKYGSGNAGLTNFWRTFGVGWAGAVVACDVLKSVIAVLLGGLLLGTQGFADVGRVFAGFCLMMGHSYPVMYGFRGGKSALCGLVTMWMVDWRAGLICLLLFGGILAFTRYVSLASMVGAASAPLSVWVFGHGGLAGTLALFCALLIIFRHRGNISRLINGREPRVRWGKRPERKLEKDDFV